MTVSNLATKSSTPSSSLPIYGERGSKVCRVTPHYWANDGSGSTCQSIIDFWVSSQRGSSNYLIDDRGDIVCAVEEEYACHTSSSEDNDRQSITIEVSTTSNSTGAITDEAWKSLIKLCTDICHRYDFKLSCNIDEKTGSLTYHYWFASTACPGQWIIDHTDELVATVNHNLETGNYDNTTTVGSGNVTSSGGVGKSVVVKDTPTAYAIGINEKILFEQAQITPYIIIINEKTAKIKYDKLKEKDVVGVLIDLKIHDKVKAKELNSYVNVNLKSQINNVRKANMPFGFIVPVNAKSVEEATKEISKIRLTLRKYPPQLGVWLDLHLGKDKKVNNQIINKYYEFFFRYGFYDQVGFYGNKKHLDLIEWQDYKELWYWTMVRHLSKFDSIHLLPTPEFFMYSGVKDEGALVEPDFTKAANLKTEPATSSTSDDSTSSSSSDSGASIAFYDFMTIGLVDGSGDAAGYIYSYYSETVLPGGGLNIVGRHIEGGDNGQGYIKDGDGNIVLARPAGGKWNDGDTLETPFGKGKFYDFCPEGRIDIYVHYP